MRLQFDDLTFDPDTRQVWARGKETRLSPKAFDLLTLLIERRPRAVSKADIRAHLWPGTHVSDSSLPSLISEIRDAIADHRRKPPLLRTLHGFGYAFSHGSTEIPTADDPSAWRRPTSNPGTGVSEEMASTSDRRPFSDCRRCLPPGSP